MQFRLLGAIHRGFARRVLLLAELGAAPPSLRQFTPRMLAFAVACTFRHLLAFVGKSQEILSSIHDGFLRASENERRIARIVPPPAAGPRAAAVLGNGRLTKWDDFSRFCGASFWGRPQHGLSLRTPA